MQESIETVKAEEDMQESIEAVKAEEDMQESIEAVKAEVVVVRRPLLGRRVTFQYYSPSWILSRNDEKRLRVVQEILETEKKYINCLRTLKLVFEDKLRALSLIPAKDIETIFPVGLVEIRERHCRLYHLLNQRLQDWNYRSIVGDLFVDFFTENEEYDLLRHYSVYSNNFPKAIKTINKWTRNSQKFEEFLQNCSNSSTCRGLDLQAYLLNPIQRLPRYCLLIKELVKFTDGSHPDRVYVEEALTTMTHAMETLNSSIQSSLRVTTEYATRRSFRSTRRRQAICRQKYSIQVSHSRPPGNTDAQERNMPPYDKCTDEPECAKNGRSRPASICSSVSSGYASDEGEVPTNTILPLIGLRGRTRSDCTCVECERLKQDVALKQLVKQKFDFASSCTSPSLRRLHFLKQQNNLIPELENQEGDTDHHGNTKTAAPATEHGTRPHSMFVDKNYGVFTVGTVDNGNNGDNSNNNCVSEISLPSTDKATLPSRPNVGRAYSTGLQMQNQTTEFHKLDDRKSGGSKASLSSFQRFSSNRFSWIPQSSRESLPAGNSSPPFVLRNSFRMRLPGGAVEEDSVSVTSDMSAMSMLVDGKHATKKRSLRLRELLRQLKPKQRESTNSLSSVATIPHPPRDSSKPALQMMVSAV